MDRASGELYKLGKKRRNETTITQDGLNELGQ